MSYIDDIILAIATLLLAINTIYKTVCEKRQKTRENVPKNITEQLNIDAEVMERMEELRERLKADRVQVFEFRNGEHFANGRSAIKVSCTYELTRPGVEPMLNSILRDPILIRTMPKYIATLLKEGFIEITDMEQFKIDYPHAYLLKEMQGVKSFYAKTVRNKLHEPVGYIVVHYTDEAHKPFGKKENDRLYALKYYLEDNLTKLKEVERRIEAREEAN